MDTNTEFANVVPALGRALAVRGYTELTPVQQAVLAAGLDAADLLVSAQTGSGKTLAFGLAIAPTLLGGADRFVPAKAPLALVIAPTRELALQVRRELEWLYAQTGALVASCVGGMDMREERRVLQRGAHIVVGTPGRLRDHIERHSFDTSGLRAVVLDEADEMLDLGFREDLTFILDAAPAERRTLMFSATVPASIASLARRYQRDAVRLSTSAERSQHVDIEYRALTVAPTEREHAIINVLRYYEAKNALVFCGTRAAVNRMTSRFNNRGFAVVALSGELSQHERTHALQAMRDGRARVCIATDVAARGIDLPNLELVVHAEIPKTPETLLHRSGRTGRAGRKGVCVVIVAHNERRRTERLLASANITAEWARPPSADEIVRRDRARILEDPSLSEPASADEADFAATLLARYGAEQVAAAYLRLQAAGHSAPEELLDTAPPERDRPERGRSQSDRAGPERTEKRRDDFTGGVWFALSVGRNQKAEARWLLPMLCRFGQLNKGEVGAIKIRPDDTHVELAPGCVERFLAAIGPDRTLEDRIVVTALADAVPTRDAMREPPAPKPVVPQVESVSAAAGPGNRAVARNTDVAPKSATPPSAGDGTTASRQGRGKAGRKPAERPRYPAKDSSGGAPFKKKKKKNARNSNAPAREGTQSGNVAAGAKRTTGGTLEFGARFAPKAKTGPAPKSRRKPFGVRPDKHTPSASGTGDAPWKKPRRTSD